MVSSATEAEEAAGVFRTVMPFSSAYFTSILSTPTPPRMMSLRRPAAAASSITGTRTLVALRTTMTSKSASFLPSSSAS